MSISTAPTTLPEQPSASTVDHHIEVRFVPYKSKYDSNGAPRSIRSADIAEVIASIEDMVASLVICDHPELTKEDIAVALVYIANTPESSPCLQLHFAVTKPEVMLPALAKIIACINDDRLDDMPDGANISIRKIAILTHKHNCVAELCGHDRHKIVQTAIKPHFRIAPQPVLHNDITLYGKIISIVGIEHPQVTIETLDGQTVVCHVDMQIAQELGSRLYQTVGLYGNATYRSGLKLALEKFWVKNVTDYNETVSLSETMRILSEEFGQYFDDIEDADLYVANLRGKA